MLRQLLTHFTGIGNERESLQEGRASGEAMTIDDREGQQLRRHLGRTNRRDRSAGWMDNPGEVALFLIYSSDIKTTASVETA